MLVWTFVFVFICACVCVCMYVHVHIGYFRFSLWKSVCDPHVNMSLGHPSSYSCCMFIGSNFQPDMGFLVSFTNIMHLKMCVVCVRVECIFQCWYLLEHQNFKPHIFKHVMYRPNSSFISFSNQFSAWTQAIGKVVHHKTLEFTCSRNLLYIVRSTDTSHVGVKLNKNDKCWTMSTLVLFNNYNLKP